MGLISAIRRRLSRSGSAERRAPSTGKSAKSVAELLVANAQRKSEALPGFYTLPWQTGRPMAGKVALSRVTVRANINRLVGGAGEETILARVGEGIVSTIGSAQSHKKVLENPDEISKTVLAKGLDSGTAFEILSIDIADVDVGKNIGAELQTDQAEADKRIAQAKAEERRAMAVAAEQEMVARTQEMRAKVVEAEAEVPLAIAEAFRSGNLGVMDFVRYKNVESDTAMRRSIAKGEEESSS